MGFALDFLIKLCPGGRPYYKEILATFGNSIISYLRLSETSGATAADTSGNGRTATYTNVSLANTTHLGSPAPLLVPASAPGINWYSASLAAAFDPAELALMGWAKVSGAGVWTDGAQRDIAYLRADANNYVEIKKRTNNNQFQFEYRAGGVTNSVIIAWASTDWFHWAITVSKLNDRMRAYINGAMVGVEQNGLGVWLGALGATNVNLGTIGAGLMLWDGWMSNVVLLDREATGDEL